MNFRIIILLILLFEPFVNQAIAQSRVQNFQKYLIYRERLLSDFMVSSRGNETGTNIPASLRNIETGLMRWGDATINLSNYMAVLATEYKLLKLSSMPVDETLIEIDNVLSAMERLDISAEAFYGNTHAPHFPNGFFIRDDIPATFTQDWAWKNPSFVDYPYVRSDYTEANKRLNEMSQDQVWHLVIGLALISKLVDDTVSSPFLNSALRLTLSQRAMLISYQIIKALQYKKCFNIINNKPCFRIWNLRNPVTKMPVKRGADPRFLKFGFAEAGDFITNENFGSLHWGYSPQGFLWIRLLGFFQVAQQFSPKGNIDHLFHAGSLATIGNIWSTRDLIRLYNRHHKFFFVPDPHYEHFALISCILHNDCPKKLNREKEKYERLLNLAPVNGPSNFGNYSADDFVFEWSSINRLVWPERLGSGTNQWLQGEYSGLDYMLLFNLYCLVYENGY
ncbi:MAG: hypothetical protein WBJ84_03670 [Bacteroidales bacterium]